MNSSLSREPTREPTERTTSPARRTSADKRLAIMPGGELIRTMLNVIQVTTDQTTGVRAPPSAARSTPHPSGRAAGSVTAMSERNPDPQVVPYLLYEDADAAMDWLISAFDFTERVRDRQSDGTVRHGELLLDNGGVIMLGTPGADFRGPAKLGEITQLQCITITDLLAHRERAQAAGADVSEISIRANRAHSYTVDDPEGHRWYFSEPL